MERTFIKPGITSYCVFIRVILCIFILAVCSQAGRPACRANAYAPPPVPPFLLSQNLSPKEIARCDIMKLKVSRC